MVGVNRRRIICSASASTHVLHHRFPRSTHAPTNTKHFHGVKLNTTYIYRIALLFNSLTDSSAAGLADKGSMAGRCMMASLKLSVGRVIRAVSETRKINL